MMLSVALFAKRRSRAVDWQWIEDLRICTPPWVGTTGRGRGGRRDLVDWSCRGRRQMSLTMVRCLARECADCRRTNGSACGLRSWKFACSL